MHSDVTYTLTRFFHGREGDSLDVYVQTTNDLLFSPQETIDQDERGYETFRVMDFCMRSINDSLCYADT